MSDKSDEELVGDVDFDFELLENTKKIYPDTKSVKQQSKFQNVENQKKKEKSSVSTKQPTKKKLAVKVIPIQDDLLQAFSIGAASVKKDTTIKKKSEPVLSKEKTSGSTVEQRGNSKGKSDSTKQNIKQEKQIETKKIPVVKDVKKSDNVSENNQKNTQIKEDISKQSEVDGKEKISSQNVEPDKKQKHFDGKKEESEKAILDTENSHVNSSAQSEITISSIENSKSNIPDNKHEVMNVKERKIEPSKEERKETNVIASEADKVIKAEPGKQADEKRISSSIKSSVKSNVLENKQEEIKVKEEIRYVKEEGKEIKKVTSKWDNKIVIKHEKQLDEDKTISNTNTMTNNTQEKSANNYSTPSNKSSKTSVTKTTDKKTAAETLKRKTDDKSETTAPAKVQRTDSTTKVKDNIDSEKHIENTSNNFTEEDYKSMDNFLADQMLDKARQKATKTGVKYTVQVSPLEIADLADPSVQQIIRLHAVNVTFKHQAVKFRKKKGFATASFATVTELKEFVYQLTQIKVIEKRIDVVITSLNQPDTLSFVIHLDRNGKLLNLINSDEDPKINKPIPVGQNPHKVEFVKVPCGANGAFMHSMFPFTNNVLITRSQVGKETNPVCHGPVSVFYINSKWLEAVMDCCSDFSVNGFTLSVIGNHTSDEVTKKSHSENKVEKPITTETDQSKRTKSSMDVDECGCDNDADDSVTNMTRDVCADMLESIQKLKELEPNNPNMKKIVEMQKQLNALQNSLRKPLGSVKNLPLKDDKLAPLTPAIKKQKQMQNLEEIFEETERAERQKEDQMQQQREMEMQREKDQEQKRRSQWARNILSDYKRQGVIGEKVSEDAEKILRQRDQRLKQREREKEQRIAEALKRKEREKLRLEREEEEKCKEMEKRRLIQKIEETRLRDSQKKDKFSMNHLLWDRPSSDNEASSPSRYVSESKGSRRDKDSDQCYKRESSRLKEDTTFTSGVSDDGVDERLANFARELAQLGKIKGQSLSPPSSSKRSSDCHHSSNRDELQDSFIMSEEEYQKIVAQNLLHTIPTNFKVRVTSIANRLCPVQGCPAKVCFRDMESFMDHWSIFHQARTTMRFCPKCTAYFMDAEELENHIMKHHWLSSKEAIELVCNARVKVIPNPSFRDPFPFIPPSLS